MKKKKKYNRKRNSFPSNQNLNIYCMFTDKMERASKAAHKDKEIESLEERYKGISLSRKFLKFFAFSRRIRSFHIS